jgi:hypothetical protein
VPGPLIVCRGARVRTRTDLVLAGTGEAEVDEQVVLGRHGEPGGEWIGRLVAERDGRPVVRTTQGSATLATATVPPDDRPARALLTRLRTAPGGAAATTGGAVCCPLAAGGVLVTSFGADLGGALRDADRLTTSGVSPFPGLK